MKRISGSATIGMVPVVILTMCVLWSYFDRSFALYQAIDYPIRSGSEMIKTFDPKYADTGRVIQDTINKIIISYTFACYRDSALIYQRNIL